MSEQAVKKTEAPQPADAAPASLMATPKTKEPQTIPKVPKGIFPKTKWLFVAIKISVVELGKALFSKDRASKRMAYLFFGSLVGLISVSIVASKYFRTQSQKVLESVTEQNKTGEAFADYVAKERKEADVRAARLEIGKFVVELIPLKDENGRSGGSMNLAEIVIVIECDTGATCNYIKDHMIQARSEITNVFVPIDRQVLMTAAGKNNIKNQIRQRMNGWLSKGRIEGVYITDFIIG